MQPSVVIVHTLATVHPPSGSVALVPSFPSWFQSWQCGEASLSTGRFSELPEQSRKYSLHNTDQDTLYLGKKCIWNISYMLRIEIGFVPVVTVHINFNENITIFNQMVPVWYNPTNPTINQGTCKCSSMTRYNPLILT